MNKIKKYLRNTKEIMMKQRVTERKKQNKKESKKDRKKEKKEETRIGRRRKKK